MRKILLEYFSVKIALMLSSPNSFEFYLLPGVLRLILCIEPDDVDSFIFLTNCSKRP